MSAAVDSPGMVDRQTFSVSIIIFFYCACLFILLLLMLLLFCFVLFCFVFFCCALFSPYATNISNYVFKASCVWGSTHGHWKRIHWIRIPDPVLMWSCVSSTRRATTRFALLDFQHSTQHRSGSRQCGGKVVFGSGSPISIGSGSKVLCGEPQY